MDGVGSLGLWLVEVDTYGAGLESRRVGGEARIDRYLNSKIYLERLILSIHPSIHPINTFYLYPKYLRGRGVRATFCFP